MSMEWEQQHAGWYTSEIGGISLESDGWCFFPKALKPHIGPFKTLKEAKERALAEQPRSEGSKD